MTSLKGLCAPYPDVCANSLSGNIVDAGILVVLFMENYDINRAGYHDTKDTMANIDLDYASALVAIAIESVARATNTTETRRSRR